MTTNFFATDLCHAEKQFLRACVLCKAAHLPLLHTTNSLEICLNSSCPAGLSYDIFYQVWWHFESMMGDHRISWADRFVQYISSVYNKYLPRFGCLQQARKLRRCDSNLQNLKLWVTHSLTSKKYLNNVCTSNWSLLLFDWAGHL